MTASSRPLSLVAAVARYAEDCMLRGMSPRTVDSKVGSLRQFADWCDGLGLDRIHDITSDALAEYQADLYRYQKPNSREPLTLGTQRNRLTAVKTLFRFLARKRLLPTDPAAELELPRVSRRLPSGGLTLDDVAAVCQTALWFESGVRDRAILEVFFATGIRRMELANLDMEHVDLARRTLRVRKGKGGKDRVIPIAVRACRWVGKYLRTERQKAATAQSGRALFLDRRGRRFRPGQLTRLVSRRLHQGGVEKPGSCHLFRHTTGTMMLDNGADIRHVQEMLGHESISTTQLYTRVAIGKLQEVYARTHPAAQGTGARQPPVK